MTEDGDGSFEKQIVDDWHIAITVDKTHTHAEIWAKSEGFPVRMGQGRVVGRITDVMRTEDGHLRISMKIHDKALQKKLSQGLRDISIGTIEEDNEQEKTHS